MLSRYDGVGLLPKHLSVSNQLMMQYPLCTGEHSQAFVQNQTWQLKIIEARTKFTMPPLQKTKRLMLSDLVSVKPKCIHDQCNIYKAGKDRSRKPDQWIWLIARPVKAYYKAARHPSPPLPHPSSMFIIKYAMTAKLEFLAPTSVTQKIIDACQLPKSFYTMYEQSPW